MSFKITWKVHLKCYIIAAAIAVFLYSDWEIIAFNFLTQDFMMYPTKYLIVNFFIYIIALLIPMTIIHELLHAATYKLFGGKIKIGFKGIYAYTREVSGAALNRTQFCMVLLAPLTVISIITLLLPAWLGGIILLMNLLGSVGDLYMAFSLFKVDYKAKIIDKIYGYDVIKSAA